MEVDLSARSSGQRTRTPDRRTESAPRGHHEAEGGEEMTSLSSSFCSLHIPITNIHYFARSQRSSLWTIRVALPSTALVTETATITVCHCNNDFHRYRSSVSSSHLAFFTPYSERYSTVVNYIMLYCTVRTVTYCIQFVSSVFGSGMSLCMSVCPILNSLNCFSF